MTALTSWCGSPATADELPVGYCDSCGKITILKPKYVHRFRAQNAKCILGVENCDTCGMLHHCNSCADYFMFDYDKSWREK